MYITEYYIISHISFIYIYIHIHIHIHIHMGVPRPARGVKFGHLARSVHWDRTSSQVDIDHFSERQKSCCHDVFTKPETQCD
jgi:hypothetical protein